MKNYFYKIFSIILIFTFSCSENKIELKNKNLQTRFSFSLNDKKHYVNVFEDGQKNAFECKDITNNTLWVNRFQRLDMGANNFEFFLTDQNSGYFATSKQLSSIALMNGRSNWTFTIGDSLFLSNSRSFFISENRVLLLTWLIRNNDDKINYIHCIDKTAGKSLYNKVFSRKKILSYYLLPINNKLLNFDRKETSVFDIEKGEFLSIPQDLSKLNYYNSTLFYKDKTTAYFFNEKKRKVIAADFEDKSVKITKYDLSGLISSEDKISFLDKCGGHFIVGVERQHKEITRENVYTYNIQKESFNKIISSNSYIKVTELGEIGEEPLSENPERKKYYYLGKNDLDHVRLFQIDTEDNSFKTIKLPGEIQKQEIGLINTHNFGKYFIIELSTDKQNQSDENYDVILTYSKIKNEFLNMVSFYNKKEHHTEEWRIVDGILSDSYGENEDTTYVYTIDLINSKIINTNIVDNQIELIKY